MKAEDPSRVVSSPPSVGGDTVSVVSVVPPSAGPGDVPDDPEGAAVDDIVLN